MLNANKKHDTYATWAPSDFHYIDKASVVYLLVQSMNTIFSKYDTFSPDTYFVRIRFLFSHDLI